MSFPRRLPAALGRRIASASGSLYSRQGREFDVAIGGIPFMLATIPDMPQSIETIKVRKDQFDTEDPGEQSLTGWWRRSQASFHEGAGNLYQETTLNPNSLRVIPGNGFYTSSGVDVFTQGRLTLLKKMQASSGPAGTYSKVRGYGNGFSAVGDGALHTASAPEGPFASLHAPVGKTIVDGFVSSSQFYDISGDGTLYSGATSNPAGATTWPLGSAATRIGWGKHRLWVIGSRKIWQPDLTLAGGTAQNPIYTNPDVGWSYTCMAEGPSAMYFGGYNGYSSSIQAITFDSGGGIPTLSGATVTAVLPDGELVQKIAVLAGQYIGIGTTRGFRVGQINTDSSITYGPLVVEPAGIQTCTSLTTQGRFFVVGFSTDSANALAYRIDTSVDLNNGVFAYASDIDLGFAGSVTSLATVSGTRLICTASDGKIYNQSTTNYVDYGYVQSGRIRYRTTEFKFFQFLTLGIEPLHGTIAASIIKADGSTAPVGQITTQGDLFTDQFKYDGEPMEFASVKLELTPTTDKLQAPVVNSYLLRALPAVKPQLLITLPLLCFDMEQARSGQRYGGNTFSKDRYTALRTLEDGASVLTYQDFSGAVGDHQVVIESVKFVNTTPPRNVSGTGSGGILLVELRTVDA